MILSSLFFSDASSISSDISTHSSHRRMGVRTDDYMSFSTKERLALMIVPRLAGLVSLLCAMAMICMAWQRVAARNNQNNRNTTTTATTTATSCTANTKTRSSSNIYHRLMMGLACHVALLSAWHIVGSLAMPVDQPNLPADAHGSIGTCTAQGLGVQVSGLSVYLYYACMSFYSYEVAVRRQYQSVPIWLEPLLHTIVHVFPIGSALYLWQKDALNAGYNVCWIDNVPSGCGSGENNIPCQRGPENAGELAGWLAAVPVFFCLLVPTIVMIALYCHVRAEQSRKEKHQRQQEIQQQQEQQQQQQLPEQQLGLSEEINDDSSLHHHVKMTMAPSSTLRFRRTHRKTVAVARQAALYLLVIYWSASFTIINNIVWWVLEKQFFLLQLLSNVNINLLGLWMLWIDRYFSVSPKRCLYSASSSHSSRGGFSHEMLKRNNNHGIKQQSIPNTSATEERSGRGGEDTTLRNNNQTTTPLSSPTPSAQQPRRKESEQALRFSFNIFDGTNASGEFADFIFEGDSEDEIADAEESTRWASIQEYV